MGAAVRDHLLAQQDNILIQPSEMPLYMESIMAILRTMDDFDYEQFRAELKAQKFAPTQKAMLNLRLLLLDSCLKDGTIHNRVSTHFKKGQLTIIE
jgi:hypothetical protein